MLTTVNRKPKQRFDLLCPDAPTLARHGEAPYALLLFLEYWGTGVGGAGEAEGFPVLPSRSRSRSRSVR